jgi:hypothetical protein
LYGENDTNLNITLKYRLTLNFTGLRDESSRSSPRGLFASYGIKGPLVDAKLKGVPTPIKPVAKGFTIHKNIQGRGLQTNHSFICT